MLRNRTICAAVVFCAALLPYFNSVIPTFHWEDEYLVRDNIHIRKLSNIPDFFRPGYVNVYEAGQGKRYRPLRTATLALDYALWKGGPRGYHFTNIVFHAFAALLFWLFCLALTGNALMALFSGLLFAVHPVHAESVVWVKNRSDILCAIFYFASAAAFAFYRRAAVKVLLWVSVLLAVPAFLAKEMAVTLPFSLALSLIYINNEAGKKWRDNAWTLAPFFALLAVYLVFRKAVMPGDAASPTEFLPRVELIVVSLGEYVKTLVWPVTLSLDRILPSGAAAAIQYAFAAGFAAVLPALWFSGRRFGVFWLLLFLVLYMPVSNLVLLEGRPFAEQRMYIPSAAFCAFIAWSAMGLLPAVSGRWPKVSFGFILVLAVLWGSRTVYRNRDWRSEVNIWEKTAASDPSARSYNNLSVALLREKRYSEAVFKAKEGLRLDPSFVDAYNTLGAAYYDLGLYDLSAGAFEKAVFFSDGKAYKSLVNLASIYSLKKRYDDALRIYGRVVKDLPWLDAAYYNMGLTLMQLKREGEAAAAFSEAVALNPYNAHAYLMLGRISAARGDRPAAVRAYSGLLKLAPANTEALSYLRPDHGRH